MLTLDDLQISHNATALLRRFLQSESLILPSFEAQLTELSQRKGITYKEWWQLLDELQAQINKPGLGSLIGQVIAPKEAGILGYLTETSACMLDALQCFERFQRLVYEGNPARIALEEGICHLIWEPVYGHSTQISDEVVFASLLSILRHALGDNAIKLLNAEFAGNPMAPLNFYKQFYGCDVKFGCSALRMGIDPKYLFKPFASSDPMLHDLLLEQARAKLPETDKPDVFLQQLHQILVRCIHEGKPYASDVAQKFHISSRTLHRKLESRNLVFREVLKETRKQLVIEYLKEGHLRLAEIALLLGYSEQSAFNRAFSEWFGVSPREYKKLN